ncbi:MAG: tetratricopeptide repeat protein [Bacteroidales bacterium]|nr:tetratricopeptide repeat protein [Bacteroidales bacterium]
MDFFSLTTLYKTLEIFYSGILGNRMDAGFVSGLNKTHKLFSSKSNQFKPYITDLAFVTRNAFLHSSYYYCHICLKNLNIDNKNYLSITNQNLIDDIVEIQKYISTEIKNATIPKDWNLEDLAIDSFETIETDKSSAKNYRKELENQLINELKNSNLKIDKFKEFIANGCFYNGKTVFWIELYIWHLTKGISENEHLKTLLQNQLLADIPKYFGDIKTDQLQLTIKFDEIIAQFDEIASNTFEYLDNIEVEFAVLHNEIIEVKEVVSQINEKVDNIHEITTGNSSKADEIKDDLKILISNAVSHSTKPFSEYIPNEDDGFFIINDIFWNKIKDETDVSRLKNYYLRTDAQKTRLREVVAHNFYVIDELTNEKFDTSLNACSDLSLIKILSKGGEGKSTFLHHIAKQYQNDYFVIYIQTIKEGALEKIRQTIESEINKTEKTFPVLLLIDDVYDKAEVLIENAELISSKFKKYKFICVIAERNFRYDSIINFSEFENIFDNNAILNFIKTKYETEAIFEKVFGLLKTENPNLDIKTKDEAKRIFLTNKKGQRKSITERIYAIIIKLAREKKIKYRFDWADWDNYVSKSQEKALKHLYLMVAAFYQFGNSITTKFCAQSMLMKDCTEIEITEAIDENPNKPIYLINDNLYLRHETIAEWFIEEEAKQNSVKKIYEYFFQNINDEFSKDLFLWTYRNREFKKCEYLNGLINNENVVEILNNHILLNPNALKARVELAKVYQQLGKPEDLEKAIKYLKEYIDLDPKGLHPRTELAKVYQQNNDYTKAEQILLELLEIDEKNLQAHTELAKVYQQNNDYTKAEQILLESLKIDNKQLHPRTELAKVYQQNNDYTKAEQILLDLLEIDKNNLQARTELAKIYQHWKKYEKAERYLKEYIELESKGLHPRTELAKIYQHWKKYEKAEQILLEITEIDEKSVHARSALAEIYNEQELYSKTEEILIEWCEIVPDEQVPKIELAKCYINIKKYTEAEELLNRVIALESDNKSAFYQLLKLHISNKEYNKAIKTGKDILILEPNSAYTKTQLGQVYQIIQKYEEAEEILISALEDEPDNIYTSLELGKTYSLLGKYRLAESKYLANLKKEPNHFDSKLELGKTYAENKDNLIKAEELITECLNEQPENPEAKLNLGKIYFAQRRNVEAISVLRSRLEQDEDDLLSRLELGRIYRTIRENKKAEQILLEILTLDSTNKYARLELAKVYQFLPLNGCPQYDKAICYLKGYIELEQNDPHPITEIVRIYLRKNDLDNAEGYAKEGLKKFPYDKYFPQQLAEVYIKKGLYRKAKNQLSNYLKNQNQIKIQKIQYNYAAYLEACFYLKQHNEGLLFLDADYSSAEKIALSSPIIANQFNRLLRFCNIEKAWDFAHKAAKKYCKDYILLELALTYKFAGHSKSELKLKEAIALNPKRQYYKDIFANAKPESVKFLEKNCIGNIAGISERDKTVIVQSNSHEYVFQITNYRLQSTLEKLKVGDKLYFDLLENDKIINLEPYFEK